MKISPYDSLPIFCTLPATFCELSASRKPHADQIYSGTVCSLILYASNESQPVDLVTRDRTVHEYFK
jgi:predicted class III extradiol MEMO1 family dioxygenase